jgi:hypothetical protein
MTPPTIYELIDDPAYRTYLRTRPQVSESLAGGHPWRIWAYRLNERGGLVWSGKLIHTYSEAWTRLRTYVRDRAYADIAIVSRRQLFPQPAGLTMGWDCSWCGRCRRPTTFEEKPNHHALPVGGVVTEDEPYRCFYCGVRKSFAGDLKR